MPAFRSSFCHRCLCLDGDAFGRTCAPCRTTDKHEAERLARINARIERERITSELMAARWRTPAGQRIGASVAAGLVMVGQAHAAVPTPPDAEPFYGIIILCLLAALGLVGMWLPRPWPFRRRIASDPHAAPFGDVPTLPQGRGE